MTSLYLPPLETGTSLEALQELVAHLRAPEGCPWDREQTHQTLRTHLLEEAYETLAAMDADDPASMREEFGDLLLQITSQKTPDVVSCNDIGVIGQISFAAKVQEEQQGFFVVLNGSQGSPAGVHSKEHAMHQIFQGIEIGAVHVSCGGRLVSKTSQQVPWSSSL